MKISDIIKMLQKARKEYGDLVIVSVYDTHEHYLNIDPDAGMRVSRCSSAVKGLGIIQVGSGNGI